MYLDFRKNQKRRFEGEKRLRSVISTPMYLIGGEMTSDIFQKLCIINSYSKLLASSANSDLSPFSKFTCA